MAVALKIGGKRRVLSDDVLWFRPNREFKRRGITHLAVPCVENIEGSSVRLFLSIRDIDQRSSTIAMNFDIGEALRGPIEAPADYEVVLSPGFAGNFDDSGAMATSVVRVDGATYLFYIGWNRSVNVPFRNALGLAVNRGLGFEKINGPVLDRSQYDPCMVASAAIAQLGPSWFEMIYLSCESWDQIEGGRLRHRYNLKQATSVDLINWTREGKIAVDYQDSGEYAISKPSVLFLEEIGIWLMAFSARGDHYKIFLAQSNDFFHWSRIGHLIFDDLLEASDMQCYPELFQIENRIWLAFNGNGFGLSGVGFCELNKDSLLIALNDKAY